MFIFDERSTQRTPTPWGLEVKKRLLEKGMKQNDIVKLLQKKGFTVDKINVSNLLYGNGCSTRLEEIKLINEMLDIPYSGEEV